MLRRGIEVKDVVWEIVALGGKDFIVERTTFLKHLCSKFSVTKEDAKFAIQRAIEYDFIKKQEQSFQLLHIPGTGFSCSTDLKCAQKAAHEMAEKTEQKMAKKASIIGIGKDINWIKWLGLVLMIISILIGSWGIRSIYYFASESDHKTNNQTKKIITAINNVGSEIVKQHEITRNTIENSSRKSAKIISEAIEKGFNNLINKKSTSGKDK